MKNAEKFERVSICYRESEIDRVVEYLYALFPVCHIFTFQGPLGAGKTTLIRALLRRAGVHDVISSPTFTYVNLYKNAQGNTFYHFDLYRLRSGDDFLQAGFDEYLNAPNSWSFIEWPEIIWPALNGPVCCVSLDYADHERIAQIMLLNQ